MCQRWDRDPRIAKRDGLVGQSRSFTAEQQADFARQWMHHPGRRAGRRRSTAHTGLAHRRHRLMRGHAGHDRQAKHASMPPRAALSTKTDCRHAAHERAGQSARPGRAEQRRRAGFLTPMAARMNASVERRSLRRHPVRPAIATMPDGPFTGLSAWNTASEASTTSMPRARDAPKSLRSVSSVSMLRPQRPRIGDQTSARRSPGELHRGATARQSGRARQPAFGTR